VSGGFPAGQWDDFKLDLGHLDDTKIVDRCGVDIPFSTNVYVGSGESLRHPIKGVISLLMGVWTFFLSRSTNFYPM
jgi:hypothetical protein